MYSNMKRSLLLLTILSYFSFSAAVLSYENNQFLVYEADRYDWENHPCRRPCIEGDEPKICQYVFVVEQFSSMSKACYDCPFNKTDCSRPHCIPADGSPKMLYVVNRQMPGPLIEVCHNDEIVVDVRNTMLSESTTIHWHGFPQRTTPYMDGVPYLSQCPISPGETFRYRFKAHDAGTFFWHSHMGSQRSDGMNGALIVKVPRSKDPHALLYDEDDCRWVITDWSTQSADTDFIRQFHYRADVLPSTILINGLGPNQKYVRDGTTVYTPYTTFEVVRGTRYRMRLIDAGADDCAINMSIDGHKMLVISLDANDISPVEVDSVTIWPGERIDFIVNANQKVDNYWIRYRGHGLCENNTVHSGAILRYKGAPIREPTSPLSYNLPRTTKNTRVLNPYNLGQEANQVANISIPALNAIVEDDICTRQEKADQQIYINFDFYPLDNYDFHRAGLYGFNEAMPGMKIGSVQLNHISHKMPSFPLMSQYEMIKPHMICSSDTINKTQCMQEQCACTHVIPLKLNAVVELIFVDEGKFAVINHPMHLHGHSFRVVATEKLQGEVTVDRVKQMDKDGLIKRRLHASPLKDTIKAPGGGYTVVRFYANNPGYWFFHCHFEHHTHVGMSLIFKVGEHSDFPRVPQGFPRCGSYTPSLFPN